MSKYTLEMGDEIEVAGMRFILVEVACAYEKPARVVFKQPIEMVLEGQLTLGSGPTDVVIHLHKSTPAMYSSAAWSANCPLCMLRIDRDLDGEYVERTIVEHVINVHRIPRENIEIRTGERT